MANLPILSDRIPDLGDRAPTTEDIIGWLKEQAFAAGRIGFSNVFQPEKFSELFALDPRPDTSPTYRVPTVKSAMEFGHGQWEREQWILKTMHTYQHVVKEAAVILDKRLLAAGMSEKDLAAFKKKTSSPLLKVIELYKLENPPPKGPERVMVKILKQTDKGTTLQQAYLSVEDHLADLYPTLNSLSAYMDGRGERISNQAKGPWMYQLVERGATHKGQTQAIGKLPHKPKPQVPADHPRKYLRVDADWKELARLLRKHGGKAPFVILCQVRENALDANSSC